MGEIAEMMLGGVMCEGCGEYLGCRACEMMDIPAYCSAYCAKNRGGLKSQVCNHVDGQFFPPEPKRKPKVNKKKKK